MCVCPTCGASRPDAGIAWDRERWEVSTAQGHVQLRGMTEVRLFDMLFRAQGTRLTGEGLLERFQNGGSLGSIRARIYRLNERLALVGLSIGASKGLGYQSAGYQLVFCSEKKSHWQNNRRPQLDALKRKDNEQATQINV